MLPNSTNISLNSASINGEQYSKGKRIKSFAVLDLETNNLPWNNNNKVAITEFSIYGIAANELLAYREEEEKEENEDAPLFPLPPALPRVLHKLTLMLNPRSMVHPDAEAVTGLNNYMLENETHFDENAANTIVGFLQHLQQPVCLVAHNGWAFDFPIIKKSYEKIGMALPAEMLFIDSFKAFYEIDERRKIQTPELGLKALENEVIEIVDDSKSEEPEQVESVLQAQKAVELELVELDSLPKKAVELESLELVSQAQTAVALEPVESVSETPKVVEPEQVKSVTQAPKAVESDLQAPKPVDPELESTTVLQTKSLTEILKESTLVDRRLINESTPKRSTRKVIVEFNRIGTKRKLYTELDCRPPNLNESPCTRRSLFPEAESKHVVQNKFPKKNTYRLQQLYQRIFDLDHKAHRAEEDVKMLTQLMLHYGSDFLDYANQFAKPFHQIQNVGKAKLWSSPE